MLCVVNYAQQLGQAGLELVVDDVEVEPIGVTGLTFGESEAALDLRVGLGSHELLVDASAPSQKAR